MSDLETLSAEDKAYFDARGETAAAPALVADDDQGIAPVDDLAGGDPSGEQGETVDDVIDPDAPADPDKPTGQSKVPLAALTKERNARKEEARARAAAEQRAAILEDRWNQALATKEPAKAAEAPAEVDPNIDPLAAINELVTTTRAERAAKAEAEKQQRERDAQNEAWNKTLDRAKSEYSEAATDDPAFEETYVALRQNIATEYMEAYGLTQQQAIAEVNNYEAQQIEFAVSRGINVADHMRKIAKARNVTAPKKAPAAPAPGTDLDKLAEGVKGSTSLSAAAGGAVAQSTAQSIADMSPADFEAWLTKNGAEKFRKLAGG